MLRSRTSQLSTEPVEPLCPELQRVHIVDVERLEDTGVRIEEGSWNSQAAPGMNERWRSGAYSESHKRLI